MDNNEFETTPYPEEVMQKVANFLFGKGIAHDVKNNSIYFNDKTAKKTFIITLRKCECYEGD